MDNETTTESEQETDPDWDEDLNPSTDEIEELEQTLAPHLDNIHKLPEQHDFWNELFRTPSVHKGNYNNEYDPDQYDHIDPHEPTAALPGSEQKILVLKRRYTTNNPLWVIGDNDGSDDYIQPRSIAEILEDFHEPGRQSSECTIYPGNSDLPTVQPGNGIDYPQTPELLEMQAASRKRTGDFSPDVCPVVPGSNNLRHRSQKGREIDDDRDRPWFSDPRGYPFITFPKRKSAPQTQEVPVTTRTDEESL